MTEPYSDREYVEKYAKALEWYDAARVIQLRAIGRAIAILLVLISAAASTFISDPRYLVSAPLYLVAVICLCVAQSANENRRDAEIAALGPRPSLDS